MNWLHRLSRQAGLMIHDLREPSGKRTVEVSRKVEQSSPQPGVTVRRTTIEEVEIQQGTDVQRPSQEQSSSSPSGQDNAEGKAYNP